MSGKVIADQHAFVCSWFVQLVARNHPQKLPTMHLPVFNVLVVRLLWSNNNFAVLGALQFCQILFPKVLTHFFQCMARFSCDLAFLQCVCPNLGIGRSIWMMASSLGKSMFAHLSQRAKAFFACWLLCCCVSVSWERALSCSKTVHLPLFAVPILSRLSLWFEFDKTNQHKTFCETSGKHRNNDTRLFLHMPYRIPPQSLWSSWLSGAPAVLVVPTVHTWFIDVTKHTYRGHPTILVTEEKQPHFITTRQITFMSNC